METGDEPVVALVDRGYVHEIMVRARKLLWEDSSCSYPLDKFVQTYTDRYGHPPSIEVIRRDLEDVLVVSCCLSFLLIIPALHPLYSICFLFCFFPDGNLRCITDPDALYLD